MSKSTSEKFNFGKFFKTYSLLFFGIFLISLAYFLNLNSPKSAVNLNENKKQEKKSSSQNLNPVEFIKKYNLSETFTSQSYLIYDLNSKKIVAGDLVDKQVANASTTKLMTALITIKSYPLNKVLTVPKSCLNIDASNVGIFPGESFTVEDLLYAVLVKSAADAVCTISSNFLGGEAELVSKMNAESTRLNLTNTHFTNPYGFDDIKNYSSSRDLLTLIQEVSKNEKLKIMMGTKSVKITETQTKKQYEILNTNRLLFDVPGTVGYKTGTTDNAGECLIFGYRNFGVDLIIIVMNSKDRFKDATTLLDTYLAENGNSLRLYKSASEGVKIQN
ncbi:D-alanyl-D-alanine carboxypeptidase [Patescibacteria group bacterium]|nr:D-alanyl-D-alanine carboxypeptidase [Patescibacteria group bacterium]